MQEIYYWALPPEIRKRAQQAYVIWRDNPAHPSLFFKRVKESQPLYSVRIGLGIEPWGYSKKIQLRGSGLAFTMNMIGSSSKS